MADSIIYELRDGVARVTLNRPPLNILNIAMIGELQRVLAGVQSPDGVKVLVIDHQGKAFSAGVAIEDDTPGKVPEMLDKFHGVFRLLNSLTAPSVALVDGMALGGGCELAVFCDMVIAKAIGLINQVFPSEVFREKAEEFIGKLTALSGPVLKLTKRAVDQSFYRNVIDGIGAVEQLYLDELMKTEDAPEGLSAFLEKRKPVWKNR